MFRRLYFPVIMLLSGFAFSQPVGPAGKWQLVFEDNFDGNSLDTKKWNYNYTWGRTHNHRAYMADSMVKVLNGQLQIKATNKRHPSAPAGTNQWSGSFGYIPFDHISGAINSNSKFNFTYGYLEGSFKAPATLGTWPAFWTLNANGAWPPEIDILEIPAARNVHHYYYHYGPDYLNKASFGATHTGPDKSAGFHTYGVEWGPTYMRFYFDGKLLNSYTGRNECSQGKDMYAIINLAVGGWAGNPPAGAVFPCYFYSDWVRAWKMDPDPNFNFETNGISPWSPWNNAVIATDCKRSGTRGVKLTGNPVSIEQTVALTPNTKYVFGGYGKVNSGGEEIMFGVKNYGGAQVSKQIANTIFQKDSVIFQTGPANTSAVIFYFKNNGTGSACGDDFFLYKWKDCNSIEGGKATADICGTCSGGNTGKIPVTDISKCKLTSLEDQLLNNSDIIITPNPFSSTFEISTKKQYEYFIMNMNGTILEQGWGSNTEKGKILVPGVYILKINNTYLKVIKN